ncbi:MAG: hypothetical protein F4Y50_00490 [Dehalococcoidia bacterium]|nr:hypothetical protein [Dehalococcoidia bacterium]
MTTRSEIKTLESPATEFESGTHPIIEEPIYLDGVTLMEGAPVEQDAVVGSDQTFREGTLLGTLNDARLRVRQPFRVTISTENDDFIAEAVEIDEFGFGKNPSGAIRDLQLTIVELYFTLKNEAHRLGPDLKRVLRVLESKLDLTHDD